MRTFPTARAGVGKNARTFATRNYMQRMRTEHPHIIMQRVHPSKVETCRRYTFVLQPPFETARAYRKYYASPPSPRRPSSQLVCWTALLLSYTGAVERQNGTHFWRVDFWMHHDVRRCVTCRTGPTHNGTGNGKDVFWMWWKEVWCSAQNLRTPLVCVHRICLCWHLHVWFELVLCFDFLVIGLWRSTSTGYITNGGFPKPENEEHIFYLFM